MKIFKVLLIYFIYISLSYAKPLDKPYIRIGGQIHEWADAGGFREYGAYFMSFSPDDAKAIQIVRNDLYWHTAEKNYPGELGRSPSGTEQGWGILYIDDLINREARLGWDIMFLTFATPGWAMDRGANNSGYWSDTDCGPNLTANNDVARTAFTGDNPAYNEDLGSGAFAKDPNDWKDWTSRIAKRYGALVDYWNLGNEGNLNRQYADGNPNTGQHLYWTGSEQMFRDMFTYGYEAIHQNDPDIAVVFPAGAGGQGLGYWASMYGNIFTGFIDIYAEDSYDRNDDTTGQPYSNNLPLNQGWLERFISGAHPLNDGVHNRQGAKGYFDAVGIHTYARAQTSQYKIGAYDYDTYEAARNCLTRQGAGNAFVISDEHSAWPWYSEPEGMFWETYESVQADHISRCIGELLSAGCNVASIYRLFDGNPGKGERYWGLRKYTIPHYNFATGEALDTKQKRMDFLTYTTYHPNFNYVIDMEEYPADDGSGYVYSAVRYQRGTQTGWYDYKPNMNVNRPNKFTDPFHPSWYRFKYWSQAGSYDAYRVESAMVTGINNYDHSTYPSYKIVSYSDWADRYVVLIYTKQNMPTVNIAIPTHWAEGTVVSIDKRVNGDALDTDGNYNMIGQETVSVTGGRITYSSAVNQYNTFIFTRQGIDPWAKKIVLKVSPDTFSLTNTTYTIVTAELQDDYGQIVTTARNRIVFSVSGGLKLPPLYVVRPQNGVAKIELATLHVGIATVTATADGLTSGNANVTIFGLPADVTELKLTTDKNTLPADGKSITTITATLVDKEGIQIKSSTQPISFSLASGPGIFVGETSKPAVEGQSTVTLRAGYTGGYCIVTASSPIPGVPKNALRLKGTVMGTGNSFVFRDISHDAYLVQSGDVIEYDIYIPTTSTVPNGGVDLLFSDGKDLRDSGAFDQSDLSAHPKIDLTKYAYGRWYHRRIPFAYASIGKTIQSVQLVLDGDTGMNEIYVSNIKISSGAVVQKMFYGQESTINLPPDDTPPDGSTPVGYTDVVCEVISILTSLQSQVQVEIVGISRPGTARRIDLTAQPANLIANGIDTSTITATVKDSTGNLVTVTSYTVTFNLSGPGILVGTNTVITSNSVAATRIQSTNTPGSINVSAQISLPGYPVNAVVLKTSGTQTGDVYVYRDIANNIGYTTVSGDNLEYDIYMPTSSNSGYVGINLVFGNGTQLVTNNVIDEYGMTGNVKQTDLSPFASGQWFHRVLPLSGNSLSGIQSVELVQESDTLGVNEVYVANIKITNTSTVKFTVYGEQSSYAIPTETYGLNQSLVTIGTITVIGVDNVIRNSINIPTGNLQPYQLNLTAVPNVIFADGSSSATITVSVLDTAGNLSSGATNTVNLTVNGPGTLQGTNPVTVQNGVAKIYVQTTTTAGVITVTATSPGLLASSTTVTTVLPPTKLSVIAVPTVLLADGLSVSTVTATILDATGNLSTNATNVITFTVSGAAVTLQGTNPVTAQNGVAKIYVKSNTTAGQVIVTATSPGLISSSTVINIDPLPPARLIVAAIPEIITADGTSISTITATVLDTMGNVATFATNLVTFTVTGVGFLQGTNPVTVQSGVAKINLQATNIPGMAIVTANSAGLISGTTAVTTVSKEGYSLTFYSYPLQPISTPRDINVQSALRDRNGNVVFSSTVPVIMAMTDGIQYNKIFTTITVNGIATFSRNTLPQSGFYEVTIYATGYSTSTATVYATIDRATGGEVSYRLPETDKAVKLKIPANSINKDNMVVTIQPAPADTRVLNSTVFTVTVSNIDRQVENVSFTPAASLSIPYTDVKPPYGIIDGTVYNEKDVRVLIRTADNKFIPNPDSVVDTTADEINLPLNSLGPTYFALGYGGGNQSGTLTLERTVNYPNPFGDKGTVFVFGLTVPAEIKIGIYTISGKLVKTITQSGQAGYNEIFWDGTDDKNNKLANGVYFYRMNAEGNGQKVTKTERLVIMR